MKKKVSIIIGSIVVLLLIIGAIVFFVFKNQKVTVTFMDDSVVLNTIKVKKGSTAKTPPVKKEGYTLEGWYNNGVKVADDCIFEADTILVAHWIEEDANTMTITFDSNGGEAVEPMTIECDTALNLPTPVRSGYKFLNWYDKNDVFITNEAKLACQDIALIAKWEKVETKKTETKPVEVVKKYTCPSGYTLSGTKCTIEGTVSEKCPSDTKADGSLCIKTSDSNSGTRVCKEATVSIDGKGHTYTGGGDYYYIPNAYGNCAYYKWKNYTTQSQCEQAYDINHKTKWVSYLNGCYAETKMNNYETVCSSDYQYYSSTELSSKFGIHDNGKCLKKESKTKYCSEGYTLTNNKCIKTIDATLEQ